MDGHHIHLSSAAIGVLLALLIPGAAAATRVPAKAPSSTRYAPTCGNQMPPPTASGNQWRCSFSDEFDSSTGDAGGLNTAWWTPQVTATSGYATGPSHSVACYVDSADNISVSDGALHLTARKESAPFDCGSISTQYTAGMVSTAAKFSQTYGRFEVRAQVPSTLLPGLQETLWLYPQDLTAYGPWPASGEVDFAEFYSLYSLFNVPFVHYNYDAGLTDLLTNTNITTATCPINPSQYNTYGVTWEPGRFTITVNGNTCLVNNYKANGGLSATAPFDQPFFIALTQALGISTNEFSPLLTPLPATMSIDYVRAWTTTPPGADPGAIDPGSAATDAGSGATGGGSPGSAGARTDPGRLTITGVGASASRWRIADGTTFTFTLDRAAAIKLIFKRIVDGRRVNGRCVAASGRRDSAPRCKRSVGVGRLAVSGRAGRNKLPFRGRLPGGRRLTPGRYTVAITAAGVSAKPLRFTIA